MGREGERGEVGGRGGRAEVGRGGAAGLVAGPGWRRSVAQLRRWGVTTCVPTSRPFLASWPPED